MSKSGLYYIYLDTKIEGAITQLMGYFQSGVFTSEQCISVYCKYYKDVEKKFGHQFRKYGLNFKFIRRNADLVFEDGKVVFYLFNAQSNCRVVAHRNVSHIFVTHGESHKVASIKPIIRIYDHIITSGQAGVDRHLKAGIISEHDVSDHRVIRLGNTFIGQNNYHFVAESKTLLYAPTWEGGLPNENFSSIGCHTVRLLLGYIQSLGISKIVIQPHPNLGHRDQSYWKLLDKIALMITSHGVSVTMRKPELTWWERFGVNAYKYDTTQSSCAIACAITDISAMEVQLLTKRIPVIVFAEKEKYQHLVIPKKIQEYYQTNLHFVDDYHFATFSQIDTEMLDYIDGYHEYGLRAKEWSERIEWLCHFAQQQRLRRIENCQNHY